MIDHLSINFSKILRSIHLTEVLTSIQHAHPLHDVIQRRPEQEVEKDDTASALESSTAAFSYVNRRSQIIFNFEGKSLKTSQILRENIPEFLIFWNKNTSSSS
jgi:hypothetical protein